MSVSWGSGAVVVPLAATAHLRLGLGSWPVFGVGNMPVLELHPWATLGVGHMPALGLDPWPARSIGRLSS